jgi:hypothetical protein
MIFYPNSRRAGGGLVVSSLSHSLLHPFRYMYATVVVSMG